VHVWFYGSGMYGFTVLANPIYTIPNKGKSIEAHNRKSCLTLGWGCADQKI